MPDGKLVSEMWPAPTSMQELLEIIGSKIAMELAGLIIGVIALVLAIIALPPVFQMFFGSPKIVLGTDAFTGGDGHILVVTIRNQPTGRLLKLIGVTRETGDVHASFDIAKLGSNEIISAANSGLLHNALTREDGLLSRAIPGFTVGCTVIGFNKGLAQIINAREERFKVLPEGHYMVHAKIMCGEKVYRLSKVVAIGTEAHKTFWAS